MHSKETLYHRLLSKDTLRSVSVQLFSAVLHVYLMYLQTLF